MGSGPWWKTSINFFTHSLRGAIKKKTTKFWTFIEKRYGHVLRGRGGQRAMSKVVFCKKVCFLAPEELLCVKISTFYMLQNMNFNITYLPKPYQKNFTFWFIRNWFCNFKLFVSKCPNYGMGRGGSEPSLSVQTFCVHTCLMGGGVSGGLDNVKSLVVFFFLMAPLSKVSWP